MSGLSLQLEQPNNVDSIQEANDIIKNKIITQHYVRQNQLDSIVNENSDDSKYDLYANHKIYNHPIGQQVFLDNAIGNTVGNIIASKIPGGKIIYPFWDAITNVMDTRELDNGNRSNYFLNKDNEIDIQFNKPLSKADRISENLTGLGALMFLPQMEAALGAAPFTGGLSIPIATTMGLTLTNFPHIRDLIDTGINSLYNTPTIKKTIDNLPSFNQIIKGLGNAIKESWNNLGNNKIW